jgi:hypothetical protein
MIAAAVLVRIEESALIAGNRLAPSKEGSRYN